MRHETVRILKLDAGGQAYCLDVEQVLAIERGARLMPNPDSVGPLGWIAGRDERIPVYSLAERLGGAPRSYSGGSVLIVNSPGRSWGLAVDRVSRFQGVPAPPSPVPPAMTDTRAAAVRGVIVDDNSLILYLSAAALHPDTAPAPPLPVEPPAPAVRRLDAATRIGPGRLLLVSPPNRVPPGLLPTLRSRLLFGISYSQVAEIVSGIEPSPVPWAPPHVLGLIAWRNRPVTVVDVGALLGLEPVERQAAARLLIVHSPRWRTPIAIPAGRDIQSRPLPLSNRPCRLGLNLGHARGMFEIAADEFVVVPDADAIAGPRGRG
jgi:chemotaxis signal transduction protein